VPTHISKAHLIGTYEKQTNVAELHAGMPPEEESRTENFIEAFDCYDLTAAAGRRAGSLKNKYARRGRTSHPRRYHRRCIAIERRCTLMIDNPKDFPMPELNCYNLPQS
jgi:predicted nucleic acid-binding protein